MSIATLHFFLSFRNILINSQAPMRPNKTQLQFIVCACRAVVMLSVGTRISSFVQSVIRLEYVRIVHRTAQACPGDCCVPVPG